MLHEAALVLVHHHHHVTLGTILFRNFRDRGGGSLLALKRLYAQHGLLPDEDADLELIKIDSIEEMCEFLTGPVSLMAGQKFDLPERPEQAGDMTV